MKTATTFLALMLCTAPSVHAQVAVDGATNTLSNTTNSFTGDVTVGTNGSFTLLILSNNALVTNSVRGLIGHNTTAKSNEVRLVSPSARWLMGNNLLVGSNGAVSRLVVSNGARVEDFDGVLANSLASSNNVALVSGSGSTWSNRGDLTVGFSGRENQLIVSNGGFVFNRFGYLGRQPGSSNNIARVTGSGSVWTNQFDLAVGANDRSNRLIIEAGGFVTCANGVVSSSSSSGNNEVLVTGSGSLWSNRFFLFLGDVAGRNRLVVSNGATLWSGGSILGTLSSALSNHVIVTGPGSVWTNESSLSLGEGSQGNRVEVSDGGRLECVDGSLGQTLAANSNGVILTGNGSGWNSRATLIVGNSGSGNTLVASNGANITASNLFVGFTPSAAGNRVTVDGGTLRVTNAAGTGVLDVRRGEVSLRAGSVDVDKLVVTNATGAFELAGGTLITRAAAITNIGGFTVGGSTTNPAIWEVRAGAGTHALAVTLYVGSSLSFNQMRIANGGTLTSGVAYIGSNPGSSSNVVLLSGPGSKWTAADLDVGNGGAFNQLIVSNGAMVEAFNGALGKNSGSSNNLAVVTGPGSLWTNRNEMNVGYEGGGNQLVVSNGATAFAQATRFIGRGSGAISNNTATVTGVGSRWLGPGNLEVGGPGSFCQLLVSAGGRVENNSGVIGSSSGASNNLVLVTDAGSLWTNAADLQVGSGGAGNQLVVSNGALLRNNNGYLGYNQSGSNSQAVITGPGSAWSNTGLLIIGNASQGNRLVVSNSAVVRDSAGYVGLDSIGNNLAVVTGPGSLWTNASDLFVGTFGAGNRLVVSAGGVVKNNNGFVGIDATANNNLALVHGSGSVWSNTLELYVGYSASRNQLVVSNGGSLFNLANSFIGFNSTALSNTALVTGAGSRWLTSSNLYLGSNGAFNTLVVSNGGQVLNRLGELGTLAGIASNNLAVVTDPGSVWSNTIQLIVGRFSSGNQLRVINGGRVESDSCIFGANFSSSNSSALVSGPGSALNLGISLSVGSASIGNQFVISNGAAVRATDSYIGFSPTSSNNEALVTSPASIWSNASSLFVGNSGRASRLIVTNGGAVVAGNRISLGEFNSSTNNRVIVDGGTLRATNQSGTAILEVRRGTNLFNAGLMDVDQLLITNTLGKFEFNGGTLITRGAFVRNGDNFLIGAAGTNRAIWDVRAGLSDTYINDVIRVGSGSSFNQLILTNGNVLTNSESADLGTSFGANSNSAVIAGVGSQWLLGDGLIVGRAGSGNRLMASNGAALVTASISYLGFQSASSNNEAEVTGPSTSWNSGSIYGLRVGYQGHNNRLRITDGALVTSGLSAIGEFSSSTNNLAAVTGAGSVWSNTLSLLVGSAGAGNQLVVSNGAAVFGYEGIIGYTESSSNNMALVTGVGSVWSNAVDLFVGNDGRGNQLVVSNGGIVLGLFGTLGLNAGANSNSVTVTDPGTRWLVTSNLSVGNNGPFSQLTVSNGARVLDHFAAIGVGFSSSNNSVLVTGSGSIWSNRTSMHVGESGKSNQLIVTDGGRVHANDADLGFNASGSNNQIIVTGPSSFYQIQNTLIVGNFGGGNRLVVSDGAGLHNDNALLGYFATNNEVMVTGAGTTWTNRSGLYVGRFRGGNRLTISNAALVVSRDTWIGTEAPATNNRVVVDGGSLLVTAVPGFGALGALDVQRGTNVLNAGLIDVMRLFITNTLGQFEFNGGKLVSGETVNNNGRVFTVGNGVSAAWFELRGGGHNFANNLTVANNSVLTGNGTVGGILTVQPGGKIAPGASIGKMVLSNSPSLQGTMQMEISKSISGVTNDSIQVAAPLSYGGTLVVSNLGPNALAAGDRFPLFTASSYTGAFANITLPTLPVTLAWTNKLVVDGSIEVVPYVPPAVGLTIQLNNGVLLVSWPTNGADYCLETSYDLSPPITWRTVTSGITTNGASFVFSMAKAATAPKQFFRLAFPCSGAPLILSLYRGNNLVTVSWPSNEFRLETTFDLAPPTNWQNVSTGITNSGGLRSFTVTNSPTTTKQFFRLAFP